MATSRKKRAARSARQSRSPSQPQGDAASRIEAGPQEFVAAQLAGAPPRAKRTGLSHADFKQRLREFDIRPRADGAKLFDAVNAIRPESSAPLAKLPNEVRESVALLRPRWHTFHGTKLSLAYFPRPMLASPCADKFGYLSSTPVRRRTRLAFTPANQALLDQLGDLMGDAGREGAPDSSIPAGFTYVGQFIDHDVTFDVSSSLESATDANTIHNMRSPALDLDSVYGRGPALDPFLYKFPASGPGSAIKLQLGSNTNTGPGGPAGSGSMEVQVDFDVPRVHNPFNPAASTHTAIIADPRNDENLLVVQWHHAMLRFHNQVVDALVLAGFTGDVFVEAKRMVTHHYQWAVVNDFLKRVCGAQAVSAALASINIPVNAPFRMPVEFAVAAYRFGHSMIRDRYWVNFNFPNATLAQIFEFNRVPRLPVFSNWVVDFNAFFDTGVAVPVNNKARKIDSVLANQLEALPGFTGLMAVLAKRNLRRGLALGLPSGQGMAAAFGIQPLSAAQLTQDLPANEIALLQSIGKLLLRHTPLWYYVLREASVLGGGNQLGPVGARIVAETFVRMLKRDAGSYLNAVGGFAPSLPSATPADFTFADLVVFSGVNQP